MASIKERSGTQEQADIRYEVRWKEGGKHRGRSFARASAAKSFRQRMAVQEEAERNGDWRAPSPAGSKTVKGYADVWLEAKAAEGLTPRTLGNRRSTLDVWIIPALGHKRLRDVVPRDLEAILGKVHKAGKGGDTRIAVYNVLNGLLDHGLGRTAHRCRDVQVKGAKRQRQPRPFTHAEMDALLAALEEPDRTFALVLGVMGLRPVECAALRVRDVDTSAWELMVDGAKGGGYRVLPLPKRLREPLARLTAGRKPNERLWRFGYDPDNWRKRTFYPALTAAGIDGHRVPYDLRHTCASTLIAKGATPVDVASWLGHSVRMTLAVYAHQFPGRKQELADLLDG